MEKKFKLVTYEQIYEAFVVYAASRSDSDWWDLWVLSRRRMGNFIAPRLARIEIYSTEADDIIDDATIELMSKLKQAQDIDIRLISKTFWYCFLHARDRYFRAKSKEKKFKSMILEPLNKKQIIRKNF